MATEGVYGFRKNNQDVLAYAYTDASLDSLGRRIISNLSTQSVENLTSGFTNSLGLAMTIHPDNYDGFPSVGIDDEHIMRRLTHQHGFIVNLDEKVMEFYNGSLFMDWAPKGRYIHSQDGPRFQGATLIHQIPLDLMLPSAVDYHVNAVEKASESKYHLHNLLEKMQKVEELKKQEADRCGVKWGRFFFFWKY